MRSTSAGPEAAGTGSSDASSTVGISVSEAENSAQGGGSATESTSARDEHQETRGRGIPSFGPLRTLQDAATRLRGIVTYGESSFVVAAAARSQLREEVYTKRRCSPAERAELDAVMIQWQYVVLVDPSGYPPRVLKAQVDDALPELEALYFGRSKQVVHRIANTTLL